MTHEELIYRLYYDPETGNFIWLNPRANCCKPGNFAGSKNACGYQRIIFNSKTYLSHRLAWFYMTGEWPNGQIDHINGFRDDNRWCNLRLASPNQNQHNSKPHKNNTSGEKGVSYYSNRDEWVAEVCLNNKRKVSYHKYWWQAVRAARKMRERLHGEYCRHE